MNGPVIHRRGDQRHDLPTCSVLQEAGQNRPLLQRGPCGCGKGVPFTEKPDHGFLSQVVKVNTQCDRAWSQSMPLTGCDETCLCGFPRKTRDPGQTMRRSSDRPQVRDNCKMPDPLFSKVSLLEKAKEVRETVAAPGSRSRHGDDFRCGVRGGGQWRERKKRDYTTAFVQ